jgi:hypothetical protein
VTLYHLTWRAPWSAITPSLVRLTWRFSSCKPFLVTVTRCSTLPLPCMGT